MEDIGEPIRQLLDAVPHRLSSKLEPHAAVIHELRKKRRTYSEIVEFLEQHLQLRVAPSTLHYFVKSRAKQARERKASNLESEQTTPVAVWQEPVAPSNPGPDEGPAQDAVRDRIRAFKNKPVPQPEPARFSFDPDQPLTLQPKKTEDKSS